MDTHEQPDQPAPGPQEAPGGRAGPTPTRDTIEE
ncbi:hypothetical protein QFZ24_005497 [Streptomyces phaeochromogenes]|nr:hypothetical protein [Streptomyces phaeochromogenes]